MAFCRLPASLEVNRAAGLVGSRAAAEARRRRPESRSPRKRPEEEAWEELMELMVFGAFFLFVSKKSRTKLKRLS